MIRKTTIYVEEYKCNKNKISKNIWKAKSIKEKKYEGGKN